MYIFNDRSIKRLHVGEKCCFSLRVGVLLHCMVLALMPHKTLNSNEVTLKHRSSFLICIGAHSTIGTLDIQSRWRSVQKLPTIVMKMSIKVGNRVYLAKRVKIIAAYKTKNASSKFFANRNNSS